MFKALIAVCVVSQFNTPEGSICYLIESPDYQKTYAGCMVMNEPKRIKIQRDFVKLNGGKSAIISQLGCKEEKSL